MFLLIDKEKGVTSHDVVDRVRKITGEKKVGHAGTLDPNAIGLLIVGVGRPSTKRLDEVSKDTKVYEAEIFLGEERDTDDVEGEVISTAGEVGPPEEGKVKEVLKSFAGEIDQEPPIFSALKVGGRKAYEMARKGEKPPLEPRKVTVHEISLLSYDYPFLKISAKVSSGTYIRALARDIGRELDVGAYLKNLKRTEIDGYSLKDAVRLRDLNSDNWKSFTRDLKI